ncbi:MAG: hypothetical protein HEEMFOPI_00989 [Holosporales bacterium]
MISVHSIFRPIRFLMRVGFYLCLIFQLFLIYTYCELSNFPEDSDTVTDAIVVFTGGENRIEEGVRLFKNGLSTRLYISGLNEKTTKVDVLKNAQYDGDLQSVDIDYARNTKENVALTASWLTENHSHAIRLVTNSYHMPRALIILSKKAPHVRIVPHIVKSKYFDTQFSTFPIFEFLKFEFAYLGQLLVF